MDLNSSIGKPCVGENIIDLSSGKTEGHGDWNSPEYLDTATSVAKKVTKVFTFYKMETDEVSDRYVAPCFVNGLEDYDGEINLGKEENMISNEFAVKLCLDYEEKFGHKVIRKELIMALRGEIYFVKFIIKPEQDDVEPGVIFGRSFMRLTKGIADFGHGTITIYPELDPFLDDSEESGKSLDGEMSIEEEEAINKIKGEALIEKEDPGADDAETVNKGITMLNHSKAEPMGVIKNVFCQVRVTNIIAKFLILDMPIDRDTPVLVRRGFLHTCSSILNTIERITSTFGRICHQTFRVAKTNLNTEESDSDDEEVKTWITNDFGKE
ncbi:hypothetical protein Tco_0331759 [Tanacetum coccineum]